MAQAWDEKGNPVSSSPKAWDERGNPVGGEMSHAEGESFAPPVPKPALPKELQSSPSDTPIRPRMGNVSDSTQMSRQEDRESHGMTAPAHPIPMARSANRAINAFGEMAAPAAIPALALAPAATIGAGLLGAAGKYGGEAIAKNSGADPDTAELIGNAASLPMSSIGGATFESPAVRGFARGAVTAVPQAIKDATIPGAAAILGHGGHVAEAATAISATPAIVRGGINGASGKPFAGPVVRSITSRPQPPVEPQPISGRPSTTGPTPGQYDAPRFRMPEVEVGGAHIPDYNPPTPPPAPERPLPAISGRPSTPGLSNVESFGSSRLPTQDEIEFEQRRAERESSFTPSAERSIVDPSLTSRIQGRPITPAPESAEPSSDFADLLQRSLDMARNRPEASPAPAATERIPIRMRRR